MAWSRGYEVGITVLIPRQLVVRTLSNRTVPKGGGRTVPQSHAPPFPATPGDGLGGLRNMDDDGSGMDDDAPEGPIPTGQVVPTVLKPLDSMLPFPGKPTPDGEFTTVYLDVNQRNTVLQQWCAGFGLSKSGNKAQMVARLHAFSGDSRRWDSLHVGATKAHYNPSGITKAHSKPKQSTLHHNRLFEEAGSSSRLLSVLPTDDTFNNQTMEEKNGILAWAVQFKAKNPYHPPNHPLRQVTRVGHGASVPAGPSSGGAIVHRALSLQAWNGLKKCWHEHKMIAEHWLGTTPTLFWTEFTNPKGEHLSYTAILGELQRRNKEQNTQAAKAAHAWYGSNFSDQFTYEKHGKTYVLSQPSSIAKQFCNME
ncbi:hypothetical protein BDN71DRAFT_1533769 [Pleurotus eryngii]|uniref:SAP domain-containing protein n=1 Tax=Pleurotus eryngii TaxID=5323 RepID=A0A9P5ZIL9_PLEER|nr:hypothetical protein BDN71DRAFT_1533769 [Pleurotus eryngii]